LKIALEIIDIMLSEMGPKLMAKQMNLWGSRPFTLTHGDLRSDNLFRSKTPGLPLTFIDWLIKNDVLRLQNTKRNTALDNLNVLELYYLYIYTANICRCE
jgi:hypothetical protein